MVVKEIKFLFGAVVLFFWRLFFVQRKQMLRQLPTPTPSAAGKPNPAPITCEKWQKPASGTYKGCQLETCFAAPECLEPASDHWYYDNPVTKLRLPPDASSPFRSACPGGNIPGWKVNSGKIHVTCTGFRQELFLRYSDYGKIFRSQQILAGNREQKRRVERRRQRRRRIPDVP